MKSRESWQANSLQDLKGAVIIGHDKKTGEVTKQYILLDITEDGYFVAKRTDAPANQKPEVIKNVDAYEWESYNDFVARERRALSLFRQSMDYKW